MIGMRSMKGSGLRISRMALGFTFGASSIAPCTSATTTGHSTALLGLLVKCRGRYEGMFCEGRRHGYGKLLYADGSRYEGGFSEDQKHGLGCFLRGREIRFGAVHRDKFTPDAAKISLNSEASDLELVTVLEEVLSEGKVSEEERMKIESFLAGRKNVELSH